MSIMYGPKQVKAWHSNMQKYDQAIFSTETVSDYVRRGNSGRPPTVSDGLSLYLKHLLTPYTAAEKEGLERTKWFTTKGSSCPALIIVILLTTCIFRVWVLPRAEHEAANARILTRRFTCWTSRMDIREVGDMDR